MPFWRTCLCLVKRRKKTIFWSTDVGVWVHQHHVGVQPYWGINDALGYILYFIFRFLFSWPLSLISHSYLWTIIQSNISYRHPRPRPPDCPHPYPAPAPGPELDPECGGGKRKDPGGNCCAPPICTGGKCPPLCSEKDAGSNPGGVGACPGGKFMPGIPCIGGGGGGHGP